MTIADRGVLVTGANRGIGQALVDEALSHLDGVRDGDEEIFPDPMSESMADPWRSGPAKALERRYAALVAADPGQS